LTDKPDPQFIHSLVDTGGILSIGDLSEGPSGIKALYRPLLVAHQ
jgi:hypothetical protein